MIYQILIWYTIHGPGALIIIRIFMGIEINVQQKKLMTYLVK